jgi:hypothetical protein
LLDPTKFPRLSIQPRAAAWQQNRTRLLRKHRAAAGCSPNDLSVKLDSLPASLPARTLTLHPITISDIVQSSGFTSLIDANVASGKVCERVTFNSAACERLVNHSAQAKFTASSNSTLSARSPQAAKFDIW